MGKNLTILFVFVTVLMMVLFSGCSNTGNIVTESDGMNDAGQDPVTLKMYSMEASANDEAFQTKLTGLLREKYPHIALEFMEPGQQIEDYIAADELPDL